MQVFFANGSLTAGLPFSFLPPEIVALSPSMWLEGAISADGDWHGRLVDRAYSSPNKQFRPTNAVKNGVGYALFANGAPIYSSDGFEEFTALDDYTLTVLAAPNTFGVMAGINNIDEGLGLIVNGDQTFLWTAGGGGNLISTSKVPQDGKFHLFTARSSPTAGSLHLDGAVALATDAHPLSPNPGGKRLVLGALHGGAFSMAGGMYAALAWPRALTDAELATVETYLLGRATTLNVS